MKAIVLVTEDAETPVAAYAVPEHWDADDVERFVCGQDYDLAAVVEVGEVACEANDPLRGGSHAERGVGNYGG